MKTLDLRLALIDLECAVIRLPLDQNDPALVGYRVQVRQLIAEFKNTHAPVDVEDWTEPAETKPLTAMGARVIFMLAGSALLWSQFGFAVTCGILCFSIAGMVRDDG